MQPIHTDVRTVIAVRVVAITSLLLATLIIQFTVETYLPVNYIYLTVALTYVLTFVYIAFYKLIESRRTNLYLQTAGDILTETVLVFFTGGLDSPFTFLYLISIITASMLLLRRGGILTASGAIILYGGLIDLMYYRLLPLQPQNILSTYWSAARLYINLATNCAGFYATAFLTSYIAEKLNRTSEELDVSRDRLARLQALNQNVVESIPSGLLTLTPSGIVTFVNPAACEILSMPEEQFVGRPLSELGLFTAEEWEELRESVVREGLIRGEKDDFVRGDELRSVGYALTPLNAFDGETVGVTLIFQDLTEMKKLESQLRFRDRMAAVGELSAGIAHEIRNPLAAIAGSVQVLKSSKNLTPQEERLMSIVLKESDRLNNTIADFLRFVKPQERRPAEFDIAASLLEILDLLANSPQSEQIEIRKEIQPPSLLISGDPNQIRQVFWNIASNALKAMPSGGLLRVATTVTLDTYEILFQDSGRGMSEAEQRLLFQPFRTNFPSGTGLGMAISYRIIQEHEGRFLVESRPGEGTSITIVLRR